MNNNHILLSFLLFPKEPGHALLSIYMKSDIKIHQQYVSIQIKIEQTSGATTNMGCP